MFNKVLLIVFVWLTKVLNENICICICNKLYKSIWFISKKNKAKMLVKILLKRFAFTLKSIIS